MNTHCQQCALLVSQVESLTRTNHEFSVALSAAQVNSHTWEQRHAAAQKRADDLAAELAAIRSHQRGADGIETREHQNPGRRHG